MKRNTTFQSKRAQIRIERILALIDGEKMTARAIAEKLHCDHSSVTDYLQYLMQEPRRVRIAGFETINRVKRPLYSAGSAANARNRTKTNKQRYAKVKADPEKYAKHLERSRATSRFARSCAGRTPPA